MHGCRRATSVGFSAQRRRSGSEIARPPVLHRMPAVVQRLFVVN